MAFCKCFDTLSDYTFQYALYKHFESFQLSTKNRLHWPTVLPTALLQMYINYVALLLDTPKQTNKAHGNVTSRLGIRIIKIWQLLYK